MRQFNGRDMECSKFMAVLFALSAVGLLSTAVITPRVESQTEDQFKRYKAVKAYEIRPGKMPALCDEQGA